MAAMERACRRTAEEIHAGGFDVLLAGPCRLFGMPFLVRHLRVPSVVYLQEPNRYLYEAGLLGEAPLPWIGTARGGVVREKRLGRFLADAVQWQVLRSMAREEWLNARACTALLVNSYYSREAVARSYGVDARVCPLGVDTERFRHLGLERGRFVAGLGSFDRIKGVDLAVRALALLPEPRPPLVWIANSGDGAYREETARLAEELGVRLEVRMRVPEAELVETLNRAALLLYTSRLEPFGYAPLEANACGAPVVAAAEAGVRETVRDGVNGLLVEREPAALAAAVRRLLDDPCLARRLGEQGERHVREEWSLERAIDRIEAELRSAAARPGAPAGVE
jgi:glycosyltransferase involved in cell wall biosynthesis